MKRPVSAIWRVHKVPGVTSASLVTAFRNAHAGNFTLKVSHGGVLDPFAEGAMLLLVGAANGLFEALHEAPKTYVAQVCWGLETDTGDSGGKEVHRGNATRLSPLELEQALLRFQGWTAQIPPATSNKRIDGERAYVKAHRGEVVSLPPQQVYCHSARWLEHDLPYSSRLEVVVRGGFYVRSLAVDLGRALGVGAHLTKLNRAAIGPYQDGLEPAQYKGSEVLPWLPSVELNDAQWGQLKAKGSLSFEAIQPGTFVFPLGFPAPSAGIRALHQGRLVALLRGEHAALMLPGGV